MNTINNSRYSILIYGDEYGTWLKSPEFSFQLCTGNLEDGIDRIQEQIDYAVTSRREMGEEIPELLEPTVKHVGKNEYGPTLLDLEQENDFGDDD